ncbi:MAG: hypothetical protein QOI89_2719 [Solirubrobacteraceae bacterium]|jgi:hypothetical protein|nr:hypothetical protein [Solirubrobacteraceae bacterium]
MALSLGEFLHPLAKASQRDLVLATMYYLERYEDEEEITTADLKAAFTKAKHTNGKKIQHASVLNYAVPYVEPKGKDGKLITWALTDTGKSQVRELLDLPAAEPDVEHDVGTLEAIAAKIADENVRSYVEEAIKCLRFGALRAAVVFLWTGAVGVLRDEVWKQGVKTVAPLVAKHASRAPVFKKKDDLAYVNDAALLLIAQELGILDKTQKERLKEALDLRNGCGHPSRYKIREKKVSSFIEDVVGIVW